jgi:hypothetical protein
VVQKLRHSRSPGFERSCRRAVASESGDSVGSIEVGNLRFEI